MARQTQKSVVQTANVRNQQVVANVPQHQLLKLDLESLILVTACLRGNQKAQKAAQQKLEAEGVIVKTPGNNKTEAYSTVLVNEAILRAPATWEAAKARVEAQRVQVKGTMPAPDQVSQIAAEAAAQQVEPEMVSEPTETQMPEEGKKEFKMDITRKIKAPELAKEFGVTTNELYELAPMTARKKGAYLSSEALIQAYDRVAAAQAFKEWQVSQKAPQPTQEAVEVEAVVEEPKVAPEPQVVIKHPEGSLAAKVAAIAPALGMQVEPATRLDFLPSIMGALRTTQYKELGVVDPDQVRNIIQHLPPKVAAEAAVLMEVVKNLRFKAAAKAKKAAADEKQRVEAIQAATRGLYQISKESLMKAWATDGWASPQNPTPQSVALAAAEKSAIDGGMSLEEALPALKAAAKEDAANWNSSLEKDRGDHRTQGALLEQRVNNLTPPQAQKVLRELGLGSNPNFRRLREFFTARLQGKTVEVTPAVYREALRIAPQLKDLFRAVYAAMEEAQLKTKEEAAPKAVPTPEAAPEAPKAEEVAEDPLGGDAAPQEQVSDTDEEQSAPHNTPEKGEEKVAMSDHEETPAEPTPAQAKAAAKAEGKAAYEAKKAAKAAAKAAKAAAKEAGAPDVEKAPKVGLKAKAQKVADAAKAKAKAAKAKGDRFGRTPVRLNEEDNNVLRAVLAAQPTEGDALLVYTQGGKDPVSEVLGASFGALAKAKGEGTPCPHNWAGHAWFFKVAVAALARRTDTKPTEGAFFAALKAVKGLPGSQQPWLAAEAAKIWAEVEAFEPSEAQTAVLEAIAFAKKLAKVKGKQGSRIAHYSWAGVLLVGRGLVGFAKWGVLPFRAVYQIAGTPIAAIKAAKGKRGAEAKAKVALAWGQVKTFGYATPKDVLARLWSKVKAVFTRKAKADVVETVVEVDGVEVIIEEAPKVEETTRGFFGKAKDTVVKAAVSVKEEVKVHPVKTALKAVGVAAVATTVAVVTASVVLTVAAAAVAVVGAVYGAKPIVSAAKAVGRGLARAGGWLKGLFSKKAAPEAAEAATASA